MKTESINNGSITRCHGMPAVPVEAPYGWGPRRVLTLRPLFSGQGRTGCVRGGEPGHKRVESVETGWGRDSERDGFICHCTPSLCLHQGPLESLQVTSSPGARVATATWGSSVNMAFCPTIGSPRTGLARHDLPPVAPSLGTRQSPWLNLWQKKPGLTGSLCSQDGKCFKPDESDLPQIQPSLYTSETCPLPRQKADRARPGDCRLEGGLWSVLARPPFIHMAASDAFQTFLEKMLTTLRAAFNGNRHICKMWTYLCNDCITIQRNIGSHPFVVVAKSCLTVCDLRHTRRPYLSLSPRGCSNSCLLSWWCHPAISSSVNTFSSCPQSFPALGSFLMSQLFTSGNQSIRASASESVLPINIQGWLFFRIDCFDLLAVQRTLKGLL